MGAPLDIGQITARAAAFQEKADRAKASLRDRNINWYPYDSLGNFTHLNQLLTGANRTLIGSHQGEAVLDIGCGDGLAGFFLESLGYDVVAIDHPAYNHNGMRGVRALKEALGSNMVIAEVDLDRQFEIPGGTYTITFLMGLLYHLQNPLYVLEQVARRSRYCFASTRIARKFPGGQAIPDELAVAYLLDDKELNDDNSNYFIFSDRGLKVALRRTQWDVLDYKSFGDVRNSDPISLARDERVYTLLKSRYGLGNLQLLEGWHDPEGSGWRWTAKNFAARISVAGSRPRELKIAAYAPPELLAGGPVTLTVDCNGAPIGTHVIERDGDLELNLPIAPSAGEDLTLRFALSAALPADAADPRERGLILASISVA